MFILCYVNFTSIFKNGYSGEKKKNWSNLDFPCAFCQYEVFCRSWRVGEEGEWYHPPHPPISVTDACVPPEPDS